MSTAGFRINSLPTSFFEKIKVGIVVSTWNDHITSELLKGAVSQLNELGLTNNQIQISEVPGAFELPLAAQWMFQKNEHIDAVICLGCVIKGDTPHFDFVCLGATNGIMEVGLKYNKPCIYGVITTNNEQQAFDRIGGPNGHKGKEAAQTAIQLLALQH